MNMVLSMDGKLPSQLETTMMQLSLLEVLGMML
jgi:hypothetical protein